MKRLPGLFTALAEEDLDQIEDYFPQTAGRVRAAIVKESLGLTKIPAKGMVLLILYSIESTMIRVLRILHAAQDWTRFFGED